MDNADAAATSARNSIKYMVNDDLKLICRNGGLNVSGVKAALQNRIVEKVYDLASSNNAIALEAFLQTISNRGRPQTTPSHGQNGGSFPLTPARHSGHTSTTNRPTPKATPKPMPATTYMAFKTSAFYEIVESLTKVHDLPETPRNRYTVNVPIVLSEDICTRLKADSSLRVMLYCAVTEQFSPMERVDIAYPGQVDVKVNNEDVKSNFRGLKNKPGTTKPTDITPFIRKVAQFQNTVTFAYALTTKRHSAVVNLVRRKSASELLDKIRREKVIKKDDVLRELTSRAQDDDIVATSTVASLTDPVSTVRIRYPCRSTICQHSRCFDAESFLQLQDQAPTWTCPICNKMIPFCTLAIDEYFQDILSSVPSTVDQVIIEPNGQWTIKTASSRDTANTHTKRASYDRDSDEDAIKISSENPKRQSLKSATPVLLQNTPPLSSRETSVANKNTHGNDGDATAGAAKKRANVIDLTLSDDEGPPAAKRPNVIARPVVPLARSSTTPGPTLPLYPRTNASSSSTPVPGQSNSGQVPYTDPFSMFSPFRNQNGNLSNGGNSTH